MSDVHAVARDQLRSFIERIENLESEKQAIADDIKDVKGEAKGMGYCVKTINTIVKMRKQDADERAEQEAILDTYLISLGMLPQPDLFDDEAHDRQTGEIIDREDRRRDRMSESMDDTKALSAEAVALGLISEKGHAETVAIADAVARKFGNGPLNPRSDAPPASAAAVISSSNDTATGEAGSPVGLPENSPETATESPRKAAEAVSERTAVQVETVNPVSAEAGIEAQASITPATSAKSAADERHVEATVEHRSSAPIPKPALSMDELRIANALILRPSCKRPGQETCGGQGRNHCRDCITAPAEKVREEA